ncbi:MAG: hypothetical protein Q8T03_13290 [Bacteroidota bacterium]|nr:hypothetical protein [Bacteroidota bacterium]
MSIQSGYTSLLWNESTQNQINALSNLVTGNFEIEAHIIASQTYFRDQIQLEVILKNISHCLKEQQGQENKNAFAMCLFNRLNLLSNK